MPKKTITCPVCGAGPDDIVTEDASYTHHPGIPQSPDKQLRQFGKSVDVSSMRCVAANYECQICRARFRWERGVGIEIMFDPTSEDDYFME